MEDDYECKIALLDWFVFIGYFVLTAVVGIIVSKRKIRTTNEYFLAKRQMPIWAVAISLLATTQSAATFLGGPEIAYRSNLTYLSTNIGTILGILVVAFVFIPKFYEKNVMTVYEICKNVMAPRHERQRHFYTSSDASSQRCSPLHGCYCHVHGFVFRYLAESHSSCYCIIG